MSKRARVLIQLLSRGERGEPFRQASKSKREIGVHITCSNIRTSAKDLIGRERPIKCKLQVAARGTIDQRFKPSGRGHPSADRTTQEKTRGEQEEPSKTEKKRDNKENQAA